MLPFVGLRIKPFTEELRERYADRIQARIARHVPNLESALRRRVALSPADLEQANVNLCGGDIYSGSCALDQNLLWRPRPGLPGHRTPVAGLYQPLGGKEPRPRGMILEGADPELASFPADHVPAEAFEVGRFAIDGLKAVKQKDRVTGAASHDFEFDAARRQPPALRHNIPFLRRSVAQNV